MINVYNNQESTSLESKILMQVHDELVFETPKNELNDLENMVVDKMVNALPLSVPIEVDSGFGQSWYEAH